MSSLELSTLKFKIGDAIKDLRTDFEFVCCEGPDYAALNRVKELSKNTWLDEDGDDMYIPSQMKIQAGTLKVPIGYTGARGTGKVKLKDLVKWLLGRGGNALTSEGIWLYSPFVDEGFAKVTLLEVGEPEYGYLGQYEILETTLTFTIPDPFDNVVFSNNAFSRV